MKSSLYTCIQDIQNGDREQALALLEKFSPLLKKYAFFMQSEDALPDFQCFLLAFSKNLQLDKLTMSTDGAIISYINKAIYHHYIALSKAQRHQLLHRVEGLGINDGLVSSFDSEPLFPRHGDESLGLITHLFRPPLHHVANVHLVM